MSRHFYVLDDYSSSKYLAVYGNKNWWYTYPKVEWEGDNFIFNICPLHPEDKSFTLRKTPLEIHLNTLKLGDFIWTWYSDLLLTEQTRNMFEAEGFTGAEYHPVVIKKVRKKDIHKIDIEPPVLYNLRCDRNKLVRLHPNSEVAVGARCPLCGFKWTTDFKYLIPDEKYWTGEDFFKVEKWENHIFITERVAEFIMKNELKPCTIIPVKEYKWGEHLLTKRKEATPEWLEKMKQFQEILNKRYEEWKLSNKNVKVTENDK